MFNLQHKAFLAVCLFGGYFVCLAPTCLGQSFNQGNSQTGTAPVLGQSEWQNPGGNAQGFSQPVPGLNSSQGNSANAMVPYSQGGGAVPNLGQSPWQNPNPGANQYQSNNQPNNQLGQNSNPGLSLSPWQQPQNGVQTNLNPNSQQNSDYYYGQINQNQPNANAPNANAFNAPQPSNQWSNNLPPVSSIPPQQTQTQKPHEGLKKTLADVTKAAAVAAGMGMGVAAPLAGVYMMSRAMSTPTYGMPAMPYGYGYPGMGMPMTYAAPNYAMMNMAPMYSSALSGLSSFMTH